MKGKPKLSKNKPSDDIVKKTSGMWKIKETGLEYTKKLRAEWEPREKAVE